ncbi:NADH-quinone oxidoreductase subunit C [Ectothiorhodospira marina]|uniref:NADH-quinone oxidoreductase subunit C n=1 Tax=Ectothiorhodospira marina TaxID=1396821 RepID=A0A1H7F5K0_9GAMM|nr:NADH-quinone oxidoreductase subunit C [Ectothiorhodospira marina]SEK19572.1 NADH-quinone oxidoreductase subunit C [Ectothiorhodospira marina]
MSEKLDRLAACLEKKFKGRLQGLTQECGEITLQVAPGDWHPLARMLRDDPELRFEMLVDVCGVDYMAYGVTEWATETSSSEGFSRGVEEATFGRFTFDEAPDAGQHQGPRFAAVYHLLSISHNHRLRVRCFCPEDEFPTVPSVVEIWSSANWFEREAFDLYGIIFEGHPDLRRILTDYGFVGHPFRKDFPLVGHVEMRYDPEQQRVIYQPVTIEPRVLVPRVIRNDHRYLDDSAEETSADA